MAIGAFFVFGAAMTLYAALTLAWPGTVLDVPWALNKGGHAGLRVLGRVAAIPFFVLCPVMVATAAGWFRRRRWGWALGVGLIAANLLGDVVNGLRGEYGKGAVGVAVAGALLVYMTRRNVREYFRVR